MQYLLTEDEYDNLHSEGDDESQQIQIAHTKLLTVIKTFVDAIDAIDVREQPSRLRGKQIYIQIDIDRVPEAIMDELVARYRGSPMDPFKSH